VEILVLHPGALGDIILSLPALRFLREQIPDARITLAANSDFAGAVASGYVGRVLSLSALPLHRMLAPAVPTPEDELLWRAYDRVLSWFGSGEAAFAAKLAQIHPCVITANWKPGPGEQRHVARLFIDSLHPWLPPPPEIPATAINLDREDRERGDDWLVEQGWTGSAPLIAVHPGAGSAVKRWPLSRFGEVARRLRAQGELLILEGPAEDGLGCDLAVRLGSRSYLACQLPLRLLAAVLRHCSAFVGNDSGIAHLAAGLGVPSVVIFGPTAPHHWAPIGEHIHVLRNTSDCRACKPETDCTHTCLNNISPQLVLASVTGAIVSK
jgi:heptosyltransferase III